MSLPSFLLLPEDVLFSITLTIVWLTSLFIFYFSTLECNLHEGRDCICYFLCLHMINSQKYFWGNEYQGFGKNITDFHYFFSWGNYPLCGVSSVFFLFKHLWIKLFFFLSIWRTVEMRPWRIEYTDTYSLEKILVLNCQYD